MLQSPSKCHQDSIPVYMSHKCFYYALSGQTAKGAVKSFKKYAEKRHVEQRVCEGVSALPGPKLPVTHEEVASHTDAYVRHLAIQSFQINVEKSTLICSAHFFHRFPTGLTPGQGIFVGQNVSDCRAAQPCFSGGKTVTLRQSQRLLCQMASSVLSIPLGHTYMRGLQLWVASLGLNPHCDSHRRVSVLVDCALVLRQWK